MWFHPQVEPKRSRKSWSSLSENTFPRSKIDPRWNDSKVWVYWHHRHLEVRASQAKTLGWDSTGNRKSGAVESKGFNNRKIDAFLLRTSPTDREVTYYQHKSVCKTITLTKSGKIIWFRSWKKIKMRYKNGLNGFTRRNYKCNSQ